MRRALVVPYSTIAFGGRSKSPNGPGVARLCGRERNLPGRLALGTFKAGWTSGRAGPFLDLHRGTTQPLKLKLDGHPEYDEVELDVPSAGEVVQACPAPARSMRSRRPRNRRAPNRPDA